MTHEGGAVSFVIRLLLGGALISGGLLYAAQALQKSPTSKEAVAEKIGPSLSTRQAAQPARAPLPVPEPTVPAASPEPPPAALPQPRVSSSFAADPGAAAPVASAGPSPAPAAPDGFGVMADEAPPDPAAEAKPTRAAANRGQRGAQGCTQYKSYNPQTQTFRTFDGKIKDCKP